MIRFQTTLTAMAINVEKNEVQNFNGGLALFSLPVHIRVNKHTVKKEFPVWWIWLNFRGVPISVEGLMKQRFPVCIMKENTMAGNFEPHDCVVFVHSTKNKGSASTVFHDKSAIKYNFAWLKPYV